VACVGKTMGLFCVAGICSNGVKMESYSDG
jgi:hypothetical protein